MFLKIEKSSTYLQPSSEDAINILENLGSNGNSDIFLPMCVIWYSLSLILSSAPKFTKS